MYNEFINGEALEYNASVMYNCMIGDRKIDTVPMALLVQLGSIVDFNVPMLETVFEKIGTPYKYEQFKDRLDRAKFWLEQCAPEQVNKLRATRNFEIWNELDDKEKAAIASLYDYIANGEYTLDELNQKLYAIPKEIYPEIADQKELKAIQGKFFKTIYKLLIDKEQGPRLYLFLYAIEKDRFVGLLDFSYAETDAEKAKNAEIEAALNPVVEEKVYGEPDPVEPIKEEKVKMDDFAKLDLRVCKIVKCQEIRKSHSCYKLTLNDGIGERVIVSSIKHDYQPEELVGKKIIVIANLEPARITGVTSNGMLLAATNNACGCKVIFVDDMVPEGTQIH
jgi:lysyl-tRNA synthetase class 1